MRIKQHEVPVRFRRMAAQHLESIRNSEMGKNTQDLYLGEEVCPIYRPDMDQIAYYEFQILKATREKVDARTDLVPDIKKLNLYNLLGHRAMYSTPGINLGLEGVAELRWKNNAQGFITVSTAGHDFPFPHWSLENVPPSMHLENEAKRSRKRIARVYKVDSMTYVAEDASQKIAGQLGDLPLMIKGFPKDISKMEGLIGSSETIRETLDKQMDDSFRFKPGRTIRRGPRPPEYSFEKTDWSAVHKNFKNNFGPMLAMLQRNAAVVWEKQKLIEEMGEGIIAGQTFNLAVLDKEFSVELSGEGARYAKLRVVKRPGGNPALEINTVRLPKDGEVDLLVTLRYENNLKEEIPLFIVNQGSPSDSKDYELKEELE